MLFRQISVRHARAHAGRTLLTVIGIALGVATVVSMRLLHASVSSSYERTITRIAGKAALQITNGEGGVPEELLEDVKRVPGVAVAVPAVAGFVSLPGRPGERLYVFGIDLLADASLRELQYAANEAEVDDPLVFLAQPDSVALTARFLERSRLGLEDSLEVLGPAGKRMLKIRASLAVRSGPATLFDGRFAVMDVFAAQRLFALDRRFTQIDVGLAEGATAAGVRAELVRVAAGRAVVETPGSRGETLERMLAANRYGMTLAAMLAAVVGVYLIFNTLMVAVAQRGREIGCLRALGMRRAEVLRLIFAESLLLGGTGSLLGVPLGLAMAKACSGLFAGTIGGIYMIAIDVPEVALDATSAAVGVVIGVASAVIAAIVPARRAVEVEPVEALRPTGRHREPSGAYGRAALAGAMLGLAVTVLWIARDALPLSRNVGGSIAMLGFLVGSSLIAPAAVRAFAVRLEPLLSRMLGPVGSLASRAIVAHIGRVAITCSAFLVSLAGAIAIATWLSSFQRTLTVWMGGVFSNVDLVISSGAKPLSNETTPIAGEIADAIAAMPGVARSDTVRIAHVVCDGLPTNLLAVDANLWIHDVRHLTLLAGDARDAFPRMLRGEAIAVNEAFRQRFRKSVGDVVELPAPAGVLRLPIAAIVFDPGFGDQGVVLVDRMLYRRAWRDDSVTFVEPALAPGVDRAAVADAIRQRFGARHALFVATIDEFRGEANELLDRTIRIAYPLVAIAIAIALLGVVNSLLASVLDRVREIGVLRAIGATRAQVARAVAVEAAIIGTLGGVLAAVVGSVLGAVQIDVLFRGMFGMTVLYRYPTGAVLFAMFAALVLAVGAGYLPGRRAARISIVAALDYE